MLIFFQHSCASQSKTGVKHKKCIVCVPHTHCRDVEVHLEGTMPRLWSASSRSINPNFSHLWYSSCRSEHKFPSRESIRLQCLSLRLDISVLWACGLQSHPRQGILCNQHGRALICGCLFEPLAVAAESKIGRCMCNGGFICSIAHFYPSFLRWGIRR